MKLLFAIVPALVFGTAFCRCSSISSGFDQRMLEGEWGHWKASCRLVHQDSLPFEDLGR